MLVTISGSMRNFQQMLVVADELTRQGAVVLMPFVRKAKNSPYVAQQMERKYPGSAINAVHMNATPITDDELDNLHLHKIDLSDMVVVVADELGYYGDSTQAEICFALRKHKRVRYARVVRRDYRDTIVFEEKMTQQWCFTCKGLGTRSGTLCTDCSGCHGSGWRSVIPAEPLPT